MSLEIDYFKHIVQQLTTEEMEVLSILHDNDANASFKAITRQKLEQMTDLTNAQFRRIIGKLTATQFIGVAHSGREHRYFITVFGQQALVSSFENGEDDE